MMLELFGRGLRRARAAAVDSVAIVLMLAILAVNGIGGAPAEAGGPVYTAKYCGPTYCAPTYAPAVKTYAQPHYAAPTYVGPTYVPPVYPEPKLQVVNNLIAIPVPVPYLQPIAKQGDTVYGYSSLSSVFPSYDPAAVFAQAERLASQANDTAREGLATYQAVHDAEADSKERVATILATSQAFREITREIGNIQSQKLRSQSFESSLPAARTQTVQDAGVATSADKVLASRCVSCHDAYRSWDALTSDKQDEMIRRMMSSDPTKRMPRGADKVSAGDPVSIEEIGALFSARKNGR